MSEACVRSVHLDDADAIAAIYAPYVRDTTISFEVDAPDAAAMRHRIEAVPKPYPYLVVEWNGAVAGYAYSGPFRSRAAYRWTVETTVYVDRTLGRHGLGRLLYQSLLDRLTELGFVSAIGIIALPNAASVGLHEALGFRQIGTEKGVGYKFGAWHDVGTWQRDLAARQDRPMEPGAAR